MGENGDPQGEGTGTSPLGEELFREIYHSVNDAIFVHDADTGEIIDVNERMCEMYGYTRAEARELTVEDLSSGTPPYTQDRALEKVRQAAAGDPQVFEWRAKRSDGTLFWVEVSLRRTVVDGETLILVIARDITGRKEHEESLREERQFVKSIFDSLPDPLYAFDTQGTPIRWNDKFETVTGYSADEIEGMHVTDFVPEHEIERIAAEFQRLLDEERSLTVESVLKTNDGDVIPYELTGAPLRNPDGTVRGVTGIGRDITDQKAREQRLEALNRATQRLFTAKTREAVAEIGVDVAQEVLDLDANAIHLHEEDGSRLAPVAITDAAYELVGEPPTFTGGDSIAWRVYEKCETLAVDDVHEDPDCYNSETAVASELYLPLDDEGILVACSPTAAAFDQQDILVGEILASNIVTALEQVDWTEQLQRREERLTRQNDRLEEFASIVSHDLRNPLDVASTRLELLAEECNSDHLPPIERAHDRMETLVDDLLALAREGEAVADLEPVGLAALAESSWANVKVDDATLVTDCDRTARADEGRLKQVFENLFRNAVNHGGDDVTVTVGTLPDGFYVEDDGPGVPEDEREDVFDAGYSTADDGTGFGLSIVAEIVEAHGWEITLSEGTDGGVCFEITGVAVES